MEKYFVIPRLEGDKIVKFEVVSQRPVGTPYLEFRLPKEWASARDSDFTREVGLVCSLLDTISTQQLSTYVQGEQILHYYNGSAYMIVRIAEEMEEEEEEVKEEESVMPCNRGRGCWCDLATDGNCPDHY